MRAIVIQGKNGAPGLEWQEVPDIGFEPHEVLVRIRATAINRADLSQARGNYPPPPGASEILGLEMAGVIEALGSDVTGWQIGDRVCALLPGGGYAEYAAVPYKMLMRLPDEWTFDQGAAVPEVWYTAYVNLFLEGSLREGETALIHAGGSGVGTAAVQLIRAAGARSFVTAGTTAKLDRCRELGAELAINYKEQEFLDEVLAATSGEGVDLILDPVGGTYLARNIQALGRFGRLVVIGTLSGGAGQMNVSLLLRNRLRIVGSTLRTRPLEEKIEIARQFEARFWPLLKSGELQPIIDRTFPIEQAQAAHQYIADDLNIGKVILRL